MPADFKGEVYKFADSVGNIRLNRVAYAFAPEAGANDERGRQMVRLTGLFDRKRVAAFIAGAVPNAKVEEREGMTLIGTERRVSFTLVGDTEFVFAGYDGDGDPLEVARQMLEVPAPARSRACSRAVAKDLRGVSDDAAGYFAIALQEKWPGV